MVVATGKDWVVLALCFQQTCKEEPPTEGAPTLKIQRAAGLKKSASWPAKSNIYPQSLSSLQPSCPPKITSCPTLEAEWGPPIIRMLDGWRLLLFKDLRPRPHSDDDDARTTVSVRWPECGVVRSAFCPSSGEILAQMSEEPRRRRRGGRAMVGRILLSWRPLGVQSKRTKSRK